MWGASIQEEGFKLSGDFHELVEGKRNLVGGLRIPGSKLAF